MRFTDLNINLNSLKLWLLVILHLFVSSHVLAQEEYTISGELQNTYSLGEHIKLLPNHNNHLDIEDILKESQQINFTFDTTLCHEVNSYWINLSITNQLENNINWHLTIFPKQYNEVYAVSGTDITLIAINGEYVKNSESCFPSNPSVIPIKLPTNKLFTFYIRVNTEIYQEFKPWVTIELKPEEQEMKAYTLNWIQLALLVGILCSLGFYIFFQFMLFRDKTFLYFFLAFFAMAVYLVMYERVGYAITRSDFFTRFTANYVALFCTFTYIGFSKYFLDPDKKFPKWHMLFRILQISYIIPLTLIILIDLGYFWNFTPYVHSIHIIAFIFMLAFAIRTYGKGHSLAGYYLWANTIFFTFLCLFIYYVIKKPVDGSIMTKILKASLKIGSIGQVLLFTMALSNRFGQLNRRMVEAKLESEQIEKKQLLNIQEITERTNLELEQKVLERITEISEQKEELEAQANNIETAYREISQQKDIIEKAHSQITDSLYYASVIQRAVLPCNDTINESFKEHFIIYWPRDIVSGDFYWHTKQQNRKFFAVADCTGHGVPGAFMSMLGISLLNEIIKRDHVINPAKILNKVRDNLINALLQDEEDAEIRDGMEIGLCRIEPNNIGTYTLCYAGSHTPCYIIKKSSATVTLSSRTELIDQQDGFTLYALKPDNIPVGKHFKEGDFTGNCIDVEPGDMVYLTTDGLTDQIGGPNNKKFSAKRFQHIIKNIHTLNAAEQKDEIENEVLQWLNEPDLNDGSPHDQIDDICLMGIRID